VIEGAETMQFGVNILNHGAGLTPEALGHWAAVAEGLGYHSIWLSDHIALARRVSKRYPEPFFDPFVTLAWLAAQTRRVRIGTTVCVLPLRHPLQTARLVANLDQLSGGRFLFGIGVGNADDEYDALGIPFRQRGAIADEALQVMLAIWTSHERVTFEGRHFRFSDVATVRPHQAPHPPILVGGRSEAALRRAVRYGQAWHASRLTTGYMTDTCIPTLHRLADELSKPVPAFVPRLKLAILDQPESDPDRLAGVGTLDQIRGDLHALEDVGAEHVVFDWNRGGDWIQEDDSHGFWQFAELADKVVDLTRGSIR
jgi:probable F420-dependent oxidoreductase